MNPNFHNQQLTNNEEGVAYHDGNATSKVASQWTTNNTSGQCTQEDSRLHVDTAKKSKQAQIQRRFEQVQNGPLTPKKPMHRFIRLLFDHYP